MLAMMNAVPLALALAVATALVPAPACADITARYGAPGAGVVVEVDDGGDARVELAGLFVLLRHQGVTWLQLDTPEGPCATELDPLITQLAADAAQGSRPRGLRPMRLVRGETGRIAGYTGTRWRLVPVEGPADSIPLQDVVLSDDPDLALLRPVFVAAGEFLITMLSAGDSGEESHPEIIRELFAKGAVLAIGDGALQSVNHREIDAARFVPAGTQVDAATMLALLDRPPPRP